MTVQDILNNARAKKKLQTGGQASAAGTVQGIQNDLSKKTIRDDAMVAQAQGIDGGAPSPTLAATTQKKGLKPGGQDPMHVIIDNADEMGGGAGGGLTGMVNKFAGKLVGKGLGAIGSFFKHNSKSAHRAKVAADTQANAPIAGKGARLVPKAQTGGAVQKNPWSFSNVAAGAGDLSKTSSAPKPKLGGMSGANAIGIGGSALTMAGDAMDAFKPIGPMNTWGIETQTKKGNKMAVASSALKGAGKGASIGASIGSVIPGFGTALGGLLGGAIGGVVGLFKGKKQVKDEAAQIEGDTTAAYSDWRQRTDLNIANSLKKAYSNYGKNGTKLVIMGKINSSKKDKISMKNRKFKVGGKLNKLGEVNIIPSGTLHKENNNLGQKDKGIPIINSEGKKQFEVEREEIIFRLKATKSIEDLVGKYKQSHNDKHLIDLGKLLEKEINTNTHDFSGRYGLEV